MSRKNKLRVLLIESERYLGGLENIGTAKMARAIARLDHQPLAGEGKRREPSCGYLDEALRAVEGADRLVAAIDAARLHLHWITYDGYPRAEIGKRFPTAHAFATLMRTPDVELGLFLIAPHTLYRDHHHAAAEFYAPLTGPHRWRFGGGDWTSLPAHVPVWNDPWAVHATLTGKCPLLCLYGWEGDIDAPAKIAHADDWAEIEASLDRQRA
jgi:hypothetical protein